MTNDAKEGLGTQIANSKALGFGVFAILAWMYSMIIAGWFPDPETFGTQTAMDVATLGTYAILVASLASFLRGEKWHAVFFMFWAAYAWSIQVQGGEAGAEAFRGWFYLTAAVFHLFLGWGALRNPNLGTDRALVALGTLLVFLGGALTGWGLPSIFGIIGGYFGLATALVAFWITAVEIGAAAESA